MNQTLHIALVGNPNVGKSSIFNHLTGGRQHVGNWPGKTVERAMGAFEHQGLAVMVVDLPGAYSLSPYSPEEEITRDYLVYEHPDLVVNVLDATNLERNLYLTAQLLELDLPLMVVLTMADLAEQRGLRIDCRALSAGLGGRPVVSTVASRGQGLDTVCGSILMCARTCCTIASTRSRPQTQNRKATACH